MPDPNVQEDLLIHKRGNSGFLHFRSLNFESYSPSHSFPKLFYFLVSFLLHGSNLTIIQLHVKVIQVQSDWLPNSAIMREKYKFFAKTARIYALADMKAKFRYNTWEIQIKS